MEDKNETLNTYTEKKGRTAWKYFTKMDNYKTSYGVWHSSLLSKKLVWNFLNLKTEVSFQSLDNLLVSGDV